MIILLAFCLIFSNLNKCFSEKHVEHLGNPKNVYKYLELWISLKCVAQWMVLLFPLFNFMRVRDIKHKFLFVFLFLYSQVVINTTIFFWSDNKSFTTPSGLQNMQRLTIVTYIKFILCIHDEQFQHNWLFTSSRWNFKAVYHWNAIFHHAYVSNRYKTQII